MQRAAGVAKARTGRVTGGYMGGILMIVAFIAVMAALNLFEFGRLD